MQCKVIKSNNEVCEANAMINSDFCFTHNPQTQQEKRAAVLKGGLASKRNINPLPAFEISDNKSVVGLLAQVINEVREGKIDLKVANCIGYLSGHLIKAMEIAELEERVENIEKTLKL